LRHPTDGSEREAVVAKVLVVDDDPVIQRLLQVNLEMEGHDVTIASDGEQALERIRADRPQLVLLDIMMPHVDGWQVAEAVRGDADLAAATQIVFLSARAQDADVQRGTALGVAAYITKPFDPIDLMELVNELTAG